MDCACGKSKPAKFSADTQNSIRAIRFGLQSSHLMGAVLSIEYLGVTISYECQDNTVNAFEIVSGVSAASICTAARSVFERLINWPV